VLRVISEFMLRDQEGISKFLQKKRRDFQIRQVKNKKQTLCSSQAHRTVASME
jgi:hypothetical protein